MPGIGWFGLEFGGVWVEVVWGEVWGVWGRVGGVVWGGLARFGVGVVGVWGGRGRVRGYAFRASAVALFCCGGAGGSLTCLLSDACTPTP